MSSIRTSSLFTKREKPAGARLQFIERESSGAVRAEQLARRTEELCAIPSPIGEERALADFVEADWHFHQFDLGAHHCGAVAVQGHGVKIEMRDWAAAFVSCNPKRFVGVSVIPMNDVDWAIKELARTLKQGLLNPMINCQAPAGCPPYRDSIYDGFWAAASEAAAPVTLHLLTGQVLSPLGGAQEQTPEERRANPAKWIELFAEIQTVLANDFIFGEILERFPHLKVVCGEYEVSWIPGFMARLDQIDENISRFHLPRLQMRASDYMRTRVYHGFINDTAAAYSIPQAGVSQVLWGSDFPHFRSIGLEAQSALHELVGALPREDQEKVVGGNAAQVFHLD